jgi:hypothetical protein
MVVVRVCAVSEKVFPLLLRMSHALLLRSLLLAGLAKEVDSLLSGSAKAVSIAAAVGGEVSEAQVVTLCVFLCLLPLVVPATFWFGFLFARFSSSTALHPPPSLCFAHPLFSLSLHPSPLSPLPCFRAPVGPSQLSGFLDRCHPSFGPLSSVRPLAWLHLCLFMWSAGSSICSPTADGSW